ncbi:MAG: acriflavine resistance protein B [Bacteroidetes bacterium]|jgi:HAE1 family hydrophobic/amphiphilic exporter-1|nr:acriflavine resistance protein B [Bacteroidota bacterium]|tara:strand:- start:2564 stop:5665 length:3102 start_codon:yes stop_codon:yes gene_type:complete
MKKLTQFSVNYPVTVSMMVVAIILLGYISFSRLGIDLLPDINAPRIFIEITAGEKPPEEIEKQYIENIEAQSIRQKGVKQVSSVCMVGSAQITVEYNWGQDMDEAFLDLQKALTSYSQNSDIDDFTISQHNPNATPIMIVGMLNSEITDMDELRLIGENYIRNELIRLDGIADVVITGAEEKEVLIETNNYLLDAYGITAGQIVQQIQNINRNVSGGTIVEMGKKYIIKGVSLIDNIDELKEVIIGYSQSNPDENSFQSNNETSYEKIPVFLKDVAKVSFINKKPINIVRINGQRCLGLSIYKETGYNTVSAADELLESFKTIKKALPGYDFIVIQNQGQFIRTAIDEVEETALLGALMAVFILYIFLRRLRVTAIISFVIPISVIATFNLMYFNGLSLNIMTLGGLALGAGMLVDNAIVVVENIFRNMETGMTVKEAAINGTAEVGGAIVASTLTTIVVFLPIVYLHGASGELFKDQAWTVAFSLLASLFVAILVIPMLFNFTHAKKSTKKVIKSVRFIWYGKTLSNILKFRFVVIIVAAIIVIGTIMILPFVGSEYLPRGGTNEFSIDIKLKEGTELERTSKTVEAIELLIKETFLDKIETIYTTIGKASTETDKSVFKNENTAVIKIRIAESAFEQSEGIINTTSDLLSKIPDAEISIIRDETALMSTMGAETASLVIEVKGDDLQEINRISLDIKDNLGRLPLVANAKTSIEEGAPEIDVIIDRYKAGINDLTVDNISSQLTDILLGKSAGKYENKGEMSNITVKMPDISKYEFNSITLKTNDGEVPLYEIAEIKESVSPKQLIRRNQNRIGKISADIDRSVPFDMVINDVEVLINEADYPPEYEISIIGEEEKRKEAMSNLSFALMLSIILVYMVMASQFESLIHPFTILLTIPLAGVGAIWAFYFLGKPLSIMAFIGIIMLAGIAVNDSIILVDAINRFRAAGKSIHDSIVSAGENRIRPIIMTSITTILALLPLTIGMGESAALRSPMAIAVIAGLISSTLLTLVVIPCVYYVFETGKEYLFGKKQ